MRFAILDHEGKADQLRRALLDRGHRAADTIDRADLLLLDCDWRWATPRPQIIRAAHTAGAKIVLYPHGGLPTTFVYDGLTRPDPLVDLRLEHGPGAIEAAELLGLELRQQACGWLYGPTRRFRPVRKPRRLLFAPQHPNMATLAEQNGHDPAPAVNQRVYQQLLRTWRTPFEVSLVGPPWRNGVWAHPRAHFTWNPQMNLATTIERIMHADIVIGAGTVAATAVALGKPTVMLGQGDFRDWVDGNYRQPDNPGVYQGLFRYPLDTDDGNLDELIGQACTGDLAVAAWRDLFIGDQDGAIVAVELLEQLVGADDGGSRNVTIQGVTVRASLHT